MKVRCPYCLQSNAQFSSREHVIPQFLGTFEPESLFLSEVCDGCNNKFSGLETIFKEDTVEGCLAAQYQLRTNSSIRFRNERMQFSNRLIGEQRIFDKVFPFVDPLTNQAKPVPHIVIEGANGKLLILMPRGVKDVKRFANRIRWTGASGSNISIFCHGDDNLKELICELGRRGVTFHERTVEQLQANCDGEFECFFEGKIDRTIKRAVAKITFNYFAFCAFASGVEHVLYESGFDKIRSYILNPNFGPELVDVRSHSLHIDGYENRKHYPFHFLAVSRGSNHLIADLSLFGHLRYTVRLAPFPFKTVLNDSFGAAHLFDLMNRHFTRADTKPHCIGSKFALF